MDCTVLLQRAASRLSICLSVYLCVYLSGLVCLDASGERGSRSDRCKGVCRHESVTRTVYRSGDAREHGMDDWTNGLLDGLLDGRVDGRVDVWTSRRGTNGPSRTPKSSNRLYSAG